MKGFIFLAVLLCGVHADDNFVAGSFTSTDSVNAISAPYANFEKTKEIWDRPGIPTASFTGSRATDVSAVKQLKNGAFAWIEQSQKYSVAWQTYFNQEPAYFKNLGNENGVFLTKICDNCDNISPTRGVAQPAGVQQNIVVSNGVLYNIATSGDYVLACGNFLQVGDEELGTNIVRQPETGCVGTQCQQWIKGMAVFQANVSTGWTWAWPQLYDSSNNPGPFFPDGGENQMVGVCATAIGVGDNGDFIVTIPKVGKLSSFRYNVASGQWTAWAQDFLWVNGNQGTDNFQVFDQTTYGYVTEFGTGGSTRSIMKRSLSDSAFTTVVTLATTNPTDWGSILKKWTVGPNDKIFATYSAYNWPNDDGHSGRNNHFDRYIWQYNGASGWDKVSKTLLSNGITTVAPSETKGYISNFNFWWDRAQSYLVAWSASGTGITEAIYAGNGADPENPTNCSHPANEDFCQARQNWYYNNFFAKRVNYVVKLDGTNWVQAYGGGFEAPPTMLTSKIGESQTYAFGCTHVYQRLSRHVSYYQRDEKANIDLWATKNLKNGVDDDPANNANSVVNYASFLGSDVLVAGSFRTIDNTEVYSLATVSDAGVPVSYGGGVKIITTSAKYPWNAFRLPGTIEHVVITGDWVYIAGTFNWAGDATSGIPVHNIAAYDRNNKKWDGLLGGVNGAIKDLLWWNDRLYVSGKFTKIGTVLANNVAYWDPSAKTWNSLNYGRDGTVQFLRPGIGGLIAFGTFTDQVWRWTGKGWWHIPVRPENTTCVAEWCNAPASITDVYVLKNIGFLLAGGKLWSFKGNRFVRNDDEYTFSGDVSSRQMGFSPSGNLLIWNKNAPDTVESHGAVEYNVDTGNFIHTIASFDTVTGFTVKYTTEKIGEISGAAQIVSSVAVIFFALVVALF